jgi:hypothetical protein
MELGAESMRRHLPVWALLGVAITAGCSKDRSRPAAVKGQVFYQGQPLSGGTIVFTPDPERGGNGPMAFGEIDTDGHYSLPLGAVPGWHRITVLSAAAPAAGGTALPARYSDPEQSGLMCKVKAGAVNVQDFRLERDS